MTTSFHYEGKFGPISSPLFIGVRVPRKGSEWSCICVLMVSFTSFYDASIGIWKCSDSVVFLGGNVPTMCSGIFCFSSDYLHRTR